MLHAADANQKHPKDFGHNNPNAYTVDVHEQVVDPVSCTLVYMYCVCVCFVLIVSIMFILYIIAKIYRFHNSSNQGRCTSLDNNRGSLMSEAKHLIGLLITYYCIITRNRLMVSTKLIEIV